MLAGSGNDFADGGSGNDRINGGRGLDVLRGGSGNDAISSRDHTKDNVRCGKGRDSVLADQIDSVGKDCEKVTRRR